MSGMLMLMCCGGWVAAWLCCWCNPSQGTLGRQGSPKVLEKLEGQLKVGDLHHPHRRACAPGVAHAHQIYTANFCRLARASVSVRRPTVHRSPFTVHCWPFTKRSAPCGRCGRCGHLFQAANKEYVIVLLSEIFPGKLQMFQGIDAWIQVSAHAGLPRSNAPRATRRRVRATARPDLWHPPRHVSASHLANHPLAGVCLPKHIVARWHALACRSTGATRLKSRYSHHTRRRLRFRTRSGRPRTQWFVAQARPDPLPICLPLASMPEILRPTAWPLLQGTPSASPSHLLARVLTGGARLRPPASLCAGRARGVHASCSGACVRAGFLRSCEW